MKYEVYDYRLQYEKVLLMILQCEHGGDSGHNGDGLAADEMRDSGIFAGTSGALSGRRSGAKDGGKCGIFHRKEPRT